MILKPRKFGLAAVIAVMTSLIPHIALAQQADSSLIKRGEYLSRASDCSSCHTDIQTNSPQFSGGQIMQLPMGQVVSPNITPSKTYGIGNYSLQDFSNAVRNGKRRDGSYLYPAMPYSAYSRLSDEDIAALYAFFMLGVKPVDQKLTNQTQMNFPFNMRLLMAGWNLLYGRSYGIELHDNASKELARGKYLVEGPGHCSACHSPRNSLMAEDKKHYLEGGFVDNWYAPNITSDIHSGIGGWSVAELTSYLKGNSVRNKGGAGGTMQDVITLSLRYMTDEDLDAIAQYLKSVPAQTASKQQQPSYSFSTPKITPLAAIEHGNAKNPTGLSDNMESDGAILYNGACASCHGIRGAGSVDGFYPSLTSNSTVGQFDHRNLIGIIQGGVDRYSQNQHIFMPGFADQLSEKQIISVASYVSDTFGNGKNTISPATITQIKKGIPEPILIRYAAWLSVLGMTLAVVIIALLCFFFFHRYKKRHKTS